MDTKKEKGADNVSLTVHQLQLVNVDRTMQDVRKLIGALQNAESVYYPNRSRLYDLYKHIEIDGTLTGICNKRVDAVANKPLRFLKQKANVDGMEGFLKSMALRDIVENILRTRFWGITGMEFIPGAEVAFEDIPRKHIKPEFGIIAVNQSDYEGIAYDGLPNVMVVGKKNDYGLYLPCAVYALFKKGGFSDWSQFVELFGQPIRVGKYDANDLLTKKELGKALNEAGGSLAIMIPKQAEFEILDGKQSNANGDLQKQLTDACNNEMMVCILHNTETTTSTNGGSNAKAKEHGKQQLEVTVSDMAYVLGWLNSPKFLGILKSYGLPVDGGYFEFEQEADLAKLTQKLNIDMQVAKMVPVADDYWYETYAIPKPENYNELKEQQRQQQQPVDPDEEPEDGDGKKPPKGKKKPKGDKPPKAKLADRIRLLLADFFAPAHPV